MAIVPIRQFGDQTLRQPSTNIEKIDKDIVEIIKNLADTMYQVGGLGLAANQIGILLSVFVMDDSAEGKNLKAYANPQIVEKSGEEECEEGCLSLGETRVPVKRYQKIKVKALDIETAEEVTIEAEGLLSRIFQHEIDHLNGKLIIDRTSTEERKNALRQLSLYNIPKL